MGSAFLIERHVKGAVRFFLFWLLILCMLPAQLLAQATGRKKRYRMESLVYECVCKILDFHVRVFGQMAEGPATLFVANHASYLDVPVLGAAIPGLFVAKSEVEHWPVFGILTRIYGTLYVERRAARAAQQKNVIRAKLEEGWRLILFPEGTSTDGLEVLPFKSSLFAVAEEPLPDGSAVQIQPVSIVFSYLSGLPCGRTFRPLYAWIGDMTLMGHLWNVFCLGHYTIDVIFHPAITLAEAGNRKMLALHCQQAVAHGVEAALAGHPMVFQQSLPARVA